MEHITQAAEDVASQASHVGIDDGRLLAMSTTLKDASIPAWDTEMHFFDGGPKSVMYTLLLDAVNFCFWPSEFTVDYNGKTYGKEDGYMALAVAIKRAFEENVPLWDPAFLANLSESDWARVFRGGGTVPLMPERLANARNIGKVLIAQFNGDPQQLISSVGGSAPALALRLAKNFDAYKDSRSYKGKTFDVLKRAQICVSDLVGAFGVSGPLGLSGAEQLTCFADYKLPQLFHCRGAFVYSPELEQKVMSMELLPEGSEEEVEIRACTIVAVERMKKALAGMGRIISAREIDWLLWNESVLGPAPGKPHHRTITTSY